MIAIYLSLLVVNHDVMRLYVAMHYAICVTEVKCFQQLKQVIPNVEVR